MEKLRKKERKIENMQEETRRIYAKELSQPDGLTEGQLAAVAKNDRLQNYNTFNTFIYGYLFFVINHELV